MTSQSSSSCVKGENEMRFQALAAVLVLWSMVVSSHAIAQAPPKEKKWFLRGYLESGVAWPHNEIGVNLRRPDLQEETGGFGDNFGRYVVRGQVFVGYNIGNKIFKDIFFVVKPNFIFGRNIPQQEYTWSFRYSGHVENVGIGISLPRNWKVYAESHKWAFRDKLGVPGDGPFELHSLIMVRKEFSFSF